MNYILSASIHWGCHNHINVFLTITFSIVRCHWQYYIKFMLDVSVQRTRVPYFARELITLSIKSLVRESTGA